MFDKLINTKPELEGANLRPLPLAISFYLYAFLPFRLYFCLFVCLNAFLSVRLSVSLSVPAKLYISGHLSNCLSVSLSVPVNLYIWASV
jgi:hypothetical protein